VDFSNASSISFHPEGNRSNKTLKGRRMSLGGIWWNDILDGCEAIFHFLRAGKWGQGIMVPKNVRTTHWDWKNHSFNL